MVANLLTLEQLRQLQDKIHHSLVEVNGAPDSPPLCPSIVLINHVPKLEGILEIYLPWMNSTAWQISPYAGAKR
jgi:hypothetical protein